MSKLILKMSMSLDGFVAGPNGEADWIFKSVDDGVNRWTYDLVSGAGLHVMGSRTFYEMRSYWPYSNDMLAAPMNDIPKLVFTQKGLDPEAKPSAQATNDANNADKSKGVSPNKTSAHLESWQHPQVASDIATEIKRLKEQAGKPMIAYGGANFAQNLVKTGLVDEYHMTIFPVILGKGMPVFTQAAQLIDLELLSIEQFGKGVVAHVYKAKV